MKMRCYFLLNIKHGASEWYLGPKYNCETPEEGPLWGRGGRGASSGGGSLQ